MSYKLVLNQGIRSLERILTCSSMQPELQSLVAESSPYAAIVGTVAGATILREFLCG